MSPTEVALAYLGAFASGDPDQVADRVTNDFENNQMGALGSRFRGAALYRERLKDFLARFEGLAYAAGEPLAQGNRVAVPYTMSARDRGRPFTVEGVMIITVEGDRVSRRDDYWDGLTYLKQVGAELPVID